MLSRLQDVPLTTVIGGHLEHEAVIGCSHFLDFQHCRLQFWMETSAVTDDAKPNAVLVKLARLATQGRKEQLHQRANLVGRTLPVLAGEGEQCQHLDTGIGADLDHRSNSIDARLVPGYTRQQAPLRPAVVAIHDDRYVTGNFPPGNLPDLFHEQLYLR